MSRPVLVSSVLVSLCRSNRHSNSAEATPSCWLISSWGRQRCQWWRLFSELMEGHTSQSYRLITAAGPLLSHVPCRSPSISFPIRCLWDSVRLWSSTETLVKVSKWGALVVCPCAHSKPPLYTHTHTCPWVRLSHGKVLPVIHCNDEKDATVPRRGQLWLKWKKKMNETQERKGLVSEICFHDGGEVQTEEEKEKEKSFVS